MSRINQEVFCNLYFTVFIHTHHIVIRSVSYCPDILEFVLISKVLSASIFSMRRRGALGRVGDAPVRRCAAHCWCWCCSTLFIQTFHRIAFSYKFRQRLLDDFRTSFRFVCLPTRRGGICVVPSPRRPSPLTSCAGSCSLGGSWEGHHHSERRFAGGWK